MKKHIEINTMIFNDVKIKHLRKLQYGAEFFALLVDLHCLSRQTPQGELLVSADGIYISERNIHTFVDLPLDIIDRGLQVLKQLEMIRITSEGYIEIIDFNAIRSCYPDNEPRTKK